MYNEQNIYYVKLLIKNSHENITTGSSILCRKILMRMISHSIAALL